MPNFDLVKLGLIFFPGIVAKLLINRFLFYKNNSAFTFTLHAFVFGCFSYACAFIMKPALSWIFGNGFQPSPYDLFIGFIADIERIDRGIILYALICSVFLAFFVGYIENKKCLQNLARFLGVTNRFSEPDVWGYLFNGSIISGNQWVVVRDKSKNLLYQGVVQAFSDSYKEAELLLSNVAVYSNITDDKSGDAPLLYTADYIYISLKSDEIDLEFFEGGKNNE